MRNYPAPCPDPLDYVPFLSPEFRKPEHLRSLGTLALRIAAWARGASTEVIRALVTFPIRHFKTETVLALAVWLLEQFPWLTIMILAYDADRAEELGKRMRELVQRVADRPYIGPARGWNRLDRWKNSEGGGVIILSADQSKEGFNCNVLICDDPMNEKQARSLEDRNAIDRAISFYTGRCLLSTDTGYTQGPVIVVASRFSRDDMTQRRIDRGGWEYLYHPAINSSGEPFAPKVFDITTLKSIRSELAVSEPLEETWWSRWMGTPVEDRGQNKFGEPARYDILPDGTDHVGIHFTGESIWFALVVTRISGGCVYVVSCDRFVAEPRELSRRIKETGIQSIYGYMSGSERIAMRHMAEQEIIINPLTAGQNLLWRTERTINLWNNARIVVPNEFNVKRFKAFTGEEEGENEEVNALVAVVEGALMWNTAASPEWAGRRRMS